MARENLWPDTTNRMTQHATVRAASWAKATRGSASWATADEIMSLEEIVHLTNLRLMKITEYKTASADSVGHLDSAINALIKEGFQPYHQPYFIGKVEGRLEDLLICQPMIKTE